MAVYLIHRDFPLPVLAIYVLRLRELRGTLESSEDLFEKLPQIVGTTARRFLNQCINFNELGFYAAALYYATDLDTAKHMILGNKLSQALRAADNEIVDKYSKVPGFAAVLKNIILYEMQDWQRAESGAVARGSGAGSCAQGRKSRWLY